MKFTVTMKSPDSVSYALEELGHLEIDEERIEGAKALIDKWFKWGEYLTVEIDTETGTCTVLEV